MTTFLYASGIRIFDYPKWAEPLPEEIRVDADRLAQEHGLDIEFIRRKDFRKENRIKEIIAKQGDHPGLVHIFSAMEPCPSYKPWHDKKRATFKASKTLQACVVSLTSSHLFLRVISKARPRSFPKRR